MSGIDVISHNVLIKWFEKVNSPQNRQLIVHYYELKQKVDDLVGKLPFQSHLIHTFCEIEWLQFAIVKEKKNDFVGELTL